MMNRVSKSTATGGRTGRPPVTSQAHILAGARRLIDQDGWDKLTIRRLAAEIGVAPTTLYHHVQDKEDLLLLLLSEYANQLPRPELPSEPRDRIVVAAAAIHDALAGWSWAAQVVTTDRLISRLGGSAQWLVETIVAGAIDHGCTPAHAVYVFRSIWYYTVGEILVRANSPRRRPGDEPPAFPADAPHLPHLAAIGDQWTPLVARDTYRQGLRAFVDGLLAQDV
jgi:AcrR family transcriptional regulator